MAEGERIRHIPDSWGFWFSGLFAGEGSFMVGPASKGRIRLRCAIGLRFDEKDLLQEIRKQLGIGQIYRKESSAEVKEKWRRNTQPIYQWEVNRLKDLHEVIIPLFRKFPLKGKKGQEFEIWSQMVELVATEGTKTSPKKKELIQALQRGRKGRVSRLYRKELIRSQARIHKA